MRCRRIIVPFLLLVLLLSVVPVLLADGARAVVIESVANLYSAASEEADVVSQAIYGGNVDLLEEREGWARVRTPDQYTGWVPLASLRRMLPGEAPYASVGSIAQVQSLFANLYREPDVTRHQPLLLVPFETSLEVTAEPETDNRRWLQVRLPDRGAAWIQRADVSFNYRPRTIKEVIALGKRFLGLPYQWGGTSSFGFDCSGFVQMLYRMRGVPIPRDTAPQARWEGFVAVQRNSLRPGDLLFFGNASDKITHVGMYIGRGRFLHATTHDQPAVQISRLKDPHWSRLFVAARRLK